ncbi:hypothetical protein LBMAG53_12440 [Planctomycetota bacterium]|nr:hypothetical protein LBMAG53_12440 [Planctomycetota bacterium]
MSASPDPVAAAASRLDEHLREMVDWHFSPATGSPFWLDWARTAGWDPRTDIRTAADLSRFPLFDDDLLRDLPNEVWIPKAYAGRPFFVFETGGTTGMPKQRLSWTDHLHDYTEFSSTLDDAAFPPGSHWLMAGPTGPRRLRLAIEHLAQLRGGSCYFLDLDPRWVKRCIAAGDFAQAEAYKYHVVDQAITILRHRRNIRCLFTTPKILEAMAERTSLPGLGIAGVFCGGTSMTPQTVRFLAEEVLEGVARFVPTYGNTLMGLACSLPLTAANGWSVIYHAPQPRAILRVVDPADPARTVDHGAWGRVELTTLTREFFMPRLLERDEARRTPPSSRFPWDGVADVRPFGAQSGKIIEGVY